MNEVQISRIGPPLSVLPDMPATWRNVDMSFDDAAEVLVRAHRDDGKGRDVPVMDLRTWRVTDQRGHFALEPLAGHRKPCELRTGSLSNLAQRLGAPVDFVRDKLPAPLQLGVLNWMLASSPKPIPSTLRLRDNAVTAVVSQRYAPLDPSELVDTVRSALVSRDLLSQVRVRAIASGPTDVLRLTLPNRSRAVRIGDVTSIGIDISSSSFARSAVHIRGMLWRLVCTNGLRAPEGVGSVSFRHIGDPQRLKEGVSEAIPSTLAHATGLMERWFRAVETFIEDVASEVEALHELTIAERDRVRAAITQEAEVGVLPRRLDAYRVVNAITQAAHEAPPARRLELEALGGRLLQKHVH